MARRYDPELALADRFKAYLEATLSEDLRMASPVVTFYDPAAQDDAHRVVVLVHNVTTLPNDRASFEAVVEVTVKSSIAQPTMQEDMSAHFDRTNEVREAVLRSEAVDEMNADSVGLGVNFIAPEISMSTDVREGWVYSETKLTVSCWARAAEDEV